MRKQIMYKQGQQHCGLRVGLSFLLGGLVVSIALFITACTTTRITSSWKNKLYKGHPKKILVIGVTKEGGKRRVFEDEFVHQFTSRGTGAIASYTILPDIKKDDDHVIMIKMKEQANDAVLITRLVSKKIVQTYVPGNLQGSIPGNLFYYPPAPGDVRGNMPGNLYYPPPYYSTWREYFGYGLTSGYVSEDEYAVIETNLYDADSEKLIWSAFSETEIIGSDISLIKSFIGVMVNEMAKDKLLNE